MPMSLEEISPSVHAPKSVVLKIKEKLFTLLPAIILLVANIFIFGTATIFKYNAVEFEFGFFESLPQLLAGLAIAGLILIGLGLVVSGRYFSIYRAFLYFLAVSVWVQGNIVVWDLGVFDGIEIQWDNFLPQRLIDLSLWVFLAIVIIYFRKKAIPVLMIACTILIFLQTGTLIYDASGDRLTAYSEEPTLFPPPGLFDYSKTRNIIQILLDGFQTETFLNIIKEDGIEKNFNGFVVYEDNVPRYGGTMSSVGAIFSGREKPAELTFSEWLKSSVNESNYLNELSNAGYAVNIVPHVPQEASRFSNYYKIPVTYGGTRSDAIDMQAARLLDFSLFRHSPGELKKIIYNDQAWLLQSNSVNNSYLGHRNQLAFFEDYSGQIRPKLDKPAYHYIHIIAPHPPFVSNKACEGQKNLAQTAENYKVQARCTLNLILKFLLQLKEIGLFDSSLIIIHADHGIAFPVKLVDGVQVPLPESAGATPKFKPGPPLVGRATALLAIKYPDSRDNLRLSNLQTSTLDISSTVLAIAGITTKLGRNNLFRPDTGEFGQRKYDNYVINGPVTATNSWYLSSTEKAKIKVPNYTFGETIDFSGLGNAEQYSVKGWSWGGIGATWTNGKSAMLKIPLSEPVSHDLNIISNIMIWGGKQAVSVTVNGKLFYQGDLTGKGFNQWRIHLPKSALHGSAELVIKFSLKDVISDYERGTGPGRRALGLRFKTLKITESEEVE